MFIAATRGDNTNILVAQIAQKRFGVEHVVVRVLDPARADWYGEQGLHTICAVKLGDRRCSRRPSREAAA